MYFNTKEEAEKYKVEHKLWCRVPEYIPCAKKYALVFPLKAQKETE